MPYSQQTWNDNDAATPLSAARMTHIEAGIAAVEAEITVTSVAGKTGVVTLVEGDVANLTSDLSAKAPLASPTFTGTPAAPTASGGTNTTQLATTAFVQAMKAALTESDIANLSTDLAAKAPLASPALTGTPTAPTAGGGTNTTQLATTAFVTGALSGLTESSISNLVADLALAFKRTIGLGKSGTISATETDSADFLVAIPYDMTLTKIKVTCKVAPTSSMVVQLRKSTDSGASFADLSGFAVTFSSGNKIAVADPADANVSEGDILNFSASSGSGTNLLVEVVGVPR